MMQERDTVDKKCSVADSPKIKDDTKPIVCSDIDGRDISNESKRDVGMMLDVIITYKNKCFPTPLPRGQSFNAEVFHRENGIFSIIPAYENIDSSDIEYTVDVRYERDVFDLMTTPPSQ